MSWFGYDKKAREKTQESGRETQKQKRNPQRFGFSSLFFLFLSLLFFVFSVLGVVEEKRREEKLVCRGLDGLMTKDGDIDR